MRKKQGTPAWKKLHSQREKKKIHNEEEDDGDKDLASQFKNLQQYWDSLQPNHPTRIPRCCSSDTKCPVGKSLYLFNNSPQKLMSSLQRTSTSSSSPLEGVWKVRTNDLAVDEILRERRAAIESGKLKGRRLFWEGATEMDLGYSDWSDMVQDNGKKSLSSSSSVSSVSSTGGGGGSDNNGGSICCGCSVCGGGGDMERRKKGVVVVMEENVGEKRDGSGRRCGIFKGRICVALVVFILCFILLGSMNDDGGGDEVFLVPT